jgi:DamX protein
LIQNNEQLLFVLADEGSGKTALLNQLNKMATDEYEHWWIQTLNSHPALSPERAFSQMLAALNVRQEGKPLVALQESLRNHIAATRYNGQLPVLFVDDAHQLPLATLKHLVELAMKGEAITQMRVVLFCEPQMTSILAAPEFEIVQQNMTHTIDIPPFTALQIRDYIQFRLKGTQYNTFHPFTSEVLKNIYTESEGIPENINQYAHQILQQFVQERHEPRLSRPQAYSKLIWGIPLVLFLIGITLWLYWNQPKNETILQPLTETIIEPPPPTLYDQQLQTVPETDITIPSITVPTWQVNTEITDSIDSANSSKPSSELARQILPPIQPNTESLAKPTNETEFQTEQLGVKGEKWLRQQNANAYTLQILGVHERLTLKQFLDKHQLNNVAMFKTSYRQKDWYVLVYGIYPNWTQANQALKTLPPELQQYKPWARSIASVQKILNK